MKNKSPYACFALLAAVILGCGGSGLERVAVSGKVSFNGQPVRAGQIRFVPQSGTEAPVTIEPIAAGEYNTNTSGGVPVGSHRVEITAYNPDEPAPSGPGSPPRRQLLPLKFNQQSTLELTVEAGGPITKNFELQP